MGEIETKDGTIVRAGATSIIPVADSYLFDVRYDAHGVRRAQVSALVGPLLPEQMQTTALAGYTPGQHALAPITAVPTRDNQFTSHKVMTFIAVACALAISFGAYAAIRIQLLNHQLAVQRDAVVPAAGRTQQSHDEALAARNAVAAMKVDLKKAEDHSRRSEGQVKLRQDALLAASSAIDSSDLPAVLNSYIKRLAQSDHAVDTFIAMGGLLAARELSAHAQTCFAAALDAPTCTKAQRLIALDGLADACWHQKELEQADAIYRELIDLERGEREVTHRSLSHLAALVKVKVRRGLDDEAEDAVTSLLARANERVRSIDSAGIKQMLASLAEFAIDNGHPTVAARLLERAVLLADASSPAETSAPLQQMLLTLHAQTGGDVEARRLMRKVLKQQQAKLDSDPEIAKTAMQLAAIDERLGDLNSAEKMLKLALDIRERSFGTNHLDVADTAYALARVYERQGRRSESEALLGMVKGIWTRKRDADRADERIIHAKDDSP